MVCQRPFKSNGNGKEGEKIVDGLRIFLHVRQEDARQEQCTKVRYSEEHHLLVENASFGHIECVKWSRLSPRRNRLSRSSLTFAGFATSSHSQPSNASRRRSCIADADAGPGGLDINADEPALV